MVELNNKDTFFKEEEGYPRNSAISFRSHNRQAMFEMTQKILNLMTLRDIGGLLLLEKSMFAFIVMRFPTENFGNDKVNRFLSMIT